MGFPPGSISNNRLQKDVNVADLEVSFKKETLEDGEGIVVVGVGGVDFKDEGEDVEDWPSAL